MIADRQSLLFVLVILVAVSSVFVGWILSIALRSNAEAKRAGWISFLSRLAGVPLLGHLLHYQDSLHPRHLRLLIGSCLGFALLGGLALLGCHAMSSGDEQGYWKWLVSGTRTDVFIRGVWMGALGGIVQGMEFAWLRDRKKSAGADLTGS